MAIAEKELKLKEYSKKYYLENKEIINQRSKEFSNNNPDYFYYYRELRKENCIYMIVKKDNKKILYVGSTSNIDNRISQHKCKNGKIYELKEKFGQDTEYYVLVAYVDKVLESREDLLILENYIINMYNTQNNGLNRMPSSNKSKREEEILEIIEKVEFRLYTK